MIIDCGSNGLVRFGLPQTGLRTFGLGVLVLDPADEGSQFKAALPQYANSRQSQDSHEAQRLNQYSKGSSLLTS